MNDNDLTEAIGRILPINKEDNSMTFKPLISAVVSGVIVAVFGYILSVGDVWKLDIHSLVNIGLMTFIASIIKYLGTTENGNFAGVVPIK